MRHSRTLYGKCPQTVGWDKMDAWLRVEGNKLSTLALAAKVQTPSAHAWRWRDSEPTGEALAEVCKLTGATEADWSTLSEKRRRKSARGAAA